MRSHAVAAIICCVACGETNVGTERVAAEPNALGIVTLEVQTEQRVTTIRGLDANEVEVAGAALRRGDVMFTPDPDLSPPQPTTGRELVVWLGGERMAPFTLRGSDFISVPEIWGGPLATFMRLDAVTRVLANGGIAFARPAAERAYTGGTCNPDKFPTSKGSVYSCCEEDGGMWVVKSSGSQLLNRALGAACSGGPANCTGTDCVYGPCGSYVYWFGPTNASGHVFHPDSSSVCGRDAGNSNWEPEEWVSQTLYPGVSPSCPYNWCCEGMPIEGTECGCGDGACEPSEDSCTCAQDCGGSCGGCGEYCNNTADCTGPGAMCSNNQCLCL